MTENLIRACPACGAAPGAPCTRVDGKPMPLPHTRRIKTETEIAPHRIPHLKTRKQPRSKPASNSTE